MQDAWVAVIARASAWAEWRGWMECRSQRRAGSMRPWKHPSSTGPWMLWRPDRRPGRSDGSTCCSTWHRPTRRPPCPNRMWWPPMLQPPSNRWDQYRVLQAAVVHALMMTDEVAAFLAPSRASDAAAAVKQVLSQCGSSASSPGPPLKPGDICVQLDHIYIYTQKQAGRLHPI